MVVTYKTPRKDLDLSPQDQLPAESPKPAAWPKVFERMAWADGVVKARLYRGAKAAVFHRITTRSGTSKGCTESLRHIAPGLGVTRRTVQRAVKAIRADGYMDIREQDDGETYICVPMLDKGVTPLRQGGDTITPPPGVTITPKRTSSSKERLKKKVPGVVDAKRLTILDQSPGLRPG